MPDSGGYVSYGAAAWLMDGTAVVISPSFDNISGPNFASYKPEIIDNALTLSPVINKTRLTSSSGEAGESYAYAIASPPVQTGPGHYILAMEGTHSALWGLRIGDTTFTLDLLNQTPANFWKINWLPDNSGALVETRAQNDTPGDVTYIAADGSQPFSLLNWLGFKIADFHWVKPADEVTLKANCFPETLNPQGDICFFLFGQPEENIPDTIDVDVIELSVGLGPSLQTIQAPQETSTPLRAGSLLVEDMNYDGFDDFGIVEFLPASPNISYLYYIYDPATSQFVFNESYRQITSPVFVGNNEIVSPWRVGAADWGTDTYTLIDGVPRLTQREEWQAINETEARHKITKFDHLTNTSEVIVDETGPIP